MFTIRDVLEKLTRGELSLAEAEAQLRFLAVEQVGDLAKLDLCRELRNGLPEIVIGDGKAPSDFTAISLNMLFQIWARHR
jgi:NCAIR mutase (PurE)-related protein